MRKIKFKIAGGGIDAGGVVYADYEDNIRFTDSGKAYIYLSQRNQSLQLDADMLTPARYERMFFLINKHGYPTILDMTRPDAIVFANSEDDREVFPEPGVAPTPESPAADGLTTALREAGFEVKAPE